MDFHVVVSLSKPTVDRGLKTTVGSTGFPLFSSFLIDFSIEFMITALRTSISIEKT
jgi:hypothetical protein